MYGVNVITYEMKNIFVAIIIMNDALREIRVIKYSKVNGNNNKKTCPKTCLTHVTSPNAYIGILYRYRRTPCFRQIFSIKLFIIVIIILLDTVL